MPNHCDNELTISGKSSDVQEVINFIRGKPYEEFGEKKECHFDFNTIIPYPKEWEEHDRIAEEHREEVDKLRAAMKNPDVPENEAHAEFMEFMKENNLEWSNIYMKDAYNKALTTVDGCDRGYDWCHKMWGTKWNAYEQDILTDQIVDDKRTWCLRFETAWSPPTPVIKALGKKFNTVKFHLRSWEAGCAFNGDFIMVKGENTIDSTVEYNPETDTEGWRGG